LKLVFEDFIGEGFNNFLEGAYKTKFKGCLNDAKKKYDAFFTNLNKENEAIRNYLILINAEEVKRREKIEKQKSLSNISCWDEFIFSWFYRGRDAKLGNNWVNDPAHRETYNVDETRANQYILWRNTDAKRISENKLKKNKNNIIDRDKYIGMMKDKLKTFFERTINFNEVLCFKGQVINREDTASFPIHKTFELFNNLTKIKPFRTDSSISRIDQVKLAYNSLFSLIELEWHPQRIYINRCTKLLDNKFNDFENFISETKNVFNTYKREVEKKYNNASPEVKSYFVNGISS